MKKSIVGLVFAIALIAVVGTVWSQTTVKTRDPLTPLKRALTASGAPALNTAQETQLTSLITAFRNANQPKGPDTTMQSVRNEYDNAVVSGNATAAAKDVALIVSNMADKATARMKAETDFAIAAIGNLSSDQLSLLVKQVGTSGVVRLVQTLAGPGGPGGGRGMAGMGQGQGPMRMGPAPR